MRLNHTALDYLRAVPVNEDERESQNNARALIHVALVSSGVFLVGSLLAALVVWAGLSHWVALPMFIVVLGGVGIIASLVGAVLYVKRRGRL